MDLGFLLIAVFVVDVVFLNTLFTVFEGKQPGAGRRLSGRAFG